MSTAQPPNIKEHNIHPDFFNEVVSRDRRFIVMSCIEERDVGDYILMKEFFNKEYTGRGIMVKILSISNSEQGMDHGYEIIGFSVLDVK